jgi:hypothetical protein
LACKLTQSESSSTQLLSAAVHRLLNESSREVAKPRSREAAKGPNLTPVFSAPPRLRVTTELLPQCAGLACKLSHAESSSTQLLSAAVHRLLNESSREVAKGPNLTPVFSAPSRLRVTTEHLPQFAALACKLTQSESSSTQLLSAAVHRLLNESSREVAKPRREQT